MPWTPPNEAPPVEIRQVLTGQKALVTGASKGLGAAVAVGLAQAGADVVVNYFSDEAGAKDTAERVQETGRKALVYKADVSKEPEVLRMFDAMFEEFGRIDICVPNAGFQLNAPSHEMTFEQWDRVINVNLTGQFLCCREAIKAFLKQGINKDISYAAGKIICMSSVHDVIPWEGHVNYAAAKGGIMLMMKSLAQEYAKNRIRINALSPGAMRTPMNVEKLTSPEIFEEEILSLIPYKRIGEPEDAAHAAVWLASDESDYMTGSTIYIDGGMCLYPGFIGGG